MQGLPADAAIKLPVRALERFASGISGLGRWTKWKTIRGAERRGDAIEGHRPPCWARPASIPPL